MSTAPTIDVAPPRYAPTRDPNMATDGGRVAVFAQTLGTPLLPWQRLVADIATEYDPADVWDDGEPLGTPGRPRRWKYRTVVVTVPRQCGKTVLTRAVFVQRAFDTHRLQAFMTAQMGKDAAERWGDLAEAVESSPVLSRVARVRRSIGSQALRFDNTGSAIRPFAPGPKAVHGYSPHLVGIDEAWAFDATDAANMLAAIRPAMQTKSDRQLWIVSTAGDSRSAFLRDLVAQGRAGDDPEMAYFEWSADPDADPWDPDTWSFHPSLGTPLLSLDDLHSEATGMRATAPAAFIRGYLNIATGARETVLRLDRWDAMGTTEQPAPSPREVSLAYDVDRDRRAASIWAAWTHDGTTYTRCVMYRHGWTWLAPMVQDLALTWRPRTIGAADLGPTRDVTDALNLAGIDVQTVSRKDYGTACESIVGYTSPDAAGDLIHDRSRHLRHAIEHAAADRTGAWDADKSTAGISPLVAMTVATRLASLAPPPPPPPLIVI